MKWKTIWEYNEIKIGVEINLANFLILQQLLFIYATVLYYKISRVAI